MKRSSVACLSGRIVGKGDVEVREGGGIFWNEHVSLQNSPDDLKPTGA